ncbi:MAG: DUF1214 domain-containing protein [Myxococcota bacterium]
MRESKKGMSGEVDPLSSGEAWAEFCDGLKAAGQDILRPTAPNSEIDLAEGHRYLTQIIRSGFELVFEAGNPADPALRVSLGGGLKVGWDNPDNLHHNATLRGGYTYRLSGTRGEAHYFSIGVYAGSFAKGGSRLIAFVDFDTLDFDEDGRFEVVLSAEEHPGNWIRLEPDTTSMMLRQIFWDRSAERPAELELERIDGSGHSRPLDAATTVAALKRVNGMMRGTNKVMFDWADRFRERPNELSPGDEESNESLQGIPDQKLACGWWEISPEQAALIEFPVPNCRYWSFVLSNYWGQSFDYERHPIHVNDRSAVRNAGGTITLVVAHRDPGLPGVNWLDTAGHDSGVWQFRWLESEGGEIPVPRVVEWGSISAKNARG